MRFREEDLREVFAEYGTVKKVQLPTDRDTGRVRGFAFVEMQSDEEEERAIWEISSQELRIYRSNSIFPVLVV